jgi:superfamily II DNA/RNA helicase
MTMETFKQLGISEPLVEGLTKQGIVVPTPIQQQIIPLALNNKDILGQSETGTGKTLAYLLPLFQKIDTAKREMQALILVPTHELAIQIQRVIELLSTDSGLAITSTPIIGNVNITRQVEKLRDKPHIIVGSSGRILELIQKKKITSQTIKTIILDEGDRLLDDNNVSGVKAVIKTTLKDRQLLLFSATITEETLAVAREMMKEPEVIKVADKTAVASTITHLYFVAEQRDKTEVLRKLVGLIKPERALVFINKSEEIDNTTAKLQYHGLKAGGIHGSSVKNDRKKAMEDFRTGKSDVLVASDLAARGLDISGITHIFNLDVPEDPQLYLHRVGRTGRAGQGGTAVSIVTVREIELIRQYERAFNIQITAKKMTQGKIYDQAAKKDGKTL